MMRNLNDFYYNFDFEKAPLSSWQAPVITASAYLALTALGCHHVEQRRKLEVCALKRKEDNVNAAALKDKPKAAADKAIDAVKGSSGSPATKAPTGGYNVPPMVVASHNMFLSFASLIMFFGITTECFRTAYKGGWNRPGNWEFMFCEEARGSPKGPIWFWIYVFHLSKYYELLDTFFVVIRGSRVPHFGFQIYHHSAAVLHSWLWLPTMQSMQFGGMVFNCFVHIVMYYYYARVSLKLPVPWKRYITKLQIIQFLTGFVVFVVGIYKFVQRYNSPYKYGPICRGYLSEDYHSVVINFFFNVTMLWKFLSIAKKGGAKKPAVTADKKKAE